MHNPQLGDDDLNPDGRSCSACQGPLYILGAFGNMAYLRCENCGAIHYLENTPDDN